MKTLTRRNVLLTLIFTLIVCLCGCVGVVSSTYASADVEVKTVEQVSPSMVKGASVRSADTFGLRYTVYMSQAEYSGLVANVGEGKEYKEVTFGVLVAPEYYENTYGVMNYENLFSSQAKYDWADINGAYSGTNGANGSKVRVINAEGTEMKTPDSEKLPEELQDQDIVIYHGSVVNFKSTANTLLNYKGVGYVCGVKQDGTKVYQIATENDNLRSMVYVAQKAVEAGEDNADAIAETYLTEEVKNTPVDYSVEYYLEDGATGEYVKNEEYSSTESANITSTVELSPLENVSGYMHIDNQLDVLSSTVYANGSTTLKYYFNKIYTQEFDLNGAKTLDVSSALADINIEDGTLQTVSVLNDDGTKTPYAFEEGTPTTLTDVVGKEKVTLLFEGENKTSIVDAKIYTLKIGNVDNLKKMMDTLDAHKVAVTDASDAIVGYVAGGYYVLTNDVVAATDEREISPGFYVENKTTANNGFNGVFDGQGYTIEGIYTLSQRTGKDERAGTYAWGLFSTLASGGVIKNVSIIAKGTDETSTNTVFGKYCHGTVENVRIHIEKGAFGGEKAPLFDSAVKSGTVMKNVLVTFGESVTFSGSHNGLVSSICDASGITIEGVYFIGAYTDTKGTMNTWCRQATSDTRYVKLMTKDGVKYGAYFASVDDFKKGIETIKGEAQAATEVYKNQIASLFDEKIWDLTGDVPELKKPA